VAVKENFLVLGTIGSRQVGSFKIIKDIINNLYYKVHRVSVGFLAQRRVLMASKRASESVMGTIAADSISRNAQLVQHVS
jgi:hypothetical protein